MSIEVLYILCITMSLLVLITGYFVGFSKSTTLDEFKQKQNENNLRGAELSEILNYKNKLINVNIAGIKSKNTNYFSLKYNVIKMSPELKTDSSLTSLAIAARLANNAKQGQKHTIIYFIKLTARFLAKLFSSIFIPSLLLCAILNSSIQSSLPKTILFITFALYIISFIIYLLLLIFDLISNKSINNDITSLNVFNYEELKSIKKLTNCLCFVDFFDNTRNTLAFLKLASLDNIFKKK